VGGQVFITEATYDRIRDIAEVTGPIPLDAKGLSEPLARYDLRSLRGRFAQAGADDADTREIVVSLPMTCRVIDGKVIRQESIDGVVVRLTRHELVARLASPLEPLTNVRLRLRYSEHGPDSEDIYGKVVRADGDGAERLSRIHLTSTSDADALRLEGLLR
jgi:hypothetical protein